MKKSLVPFVLGTVFVAVFTAFLVWRLAFLSTQPRALKDLALEVVPPDAIALAPDGDRLAYASPYGDDVVLHLRRLDDGSVTRLPSTEGAEHPFFSPDGRRLGFVVNGAIREVELEPAEASAHAPSASLPGGSWILAERGGDVIASSLADRGERVLARSAQRPRYLPPGYLLFLRDGALWAARFDPAAAELVAEPFLAVEEVDGWYDVSATGTLAFRRPGTGARRRFAVVLNWTRELERIAPARRLSGPPAR